MTPYPHPQTNLDIFRVRLGTDLAIDPSTFVVACSEPVPTEAGLAGSNCGHWAKYYNTQVDIQVTGALSGEADGFEYNRLDLAQLPLPEGALRPFLKGSAADVAGLLDAINARWGTAFLPTDIQVIPIPVCDCACGPIGFTFAANPLSLIYIGELTLYVIGDVSLSEAVTQPFLPTPVLPIILP